MTLVPLHDYHRLAGPAEATVPGRAKVTGTYRSPDGVHRTFTGSYRLERLVWQFEQPAAAGVFCGQVVQPGGAGAGVASRRQTTAVEVLERQGQTHLRLGPVEVHLLGLPVTVDEFVVVLPVPGARPSPEVPGAAQD